MSCIFALVNCSSENKHYQSMNDKTVEISIEGKAQNSKAGAIVVTNNNEVYYLENPAYWNDTDIGKTIIAKGILKVVETKSNNLKDETGAYKQGIAGKTNYLLNNTFVIH